MTLKTTVAAAAVLLSAAQILGVGAASAQTRAAAPAARPAATATAAARPAPPPIKSGPPITGVCVFSSDQVIGTSAAGKAMQARLEQLVATVKAELTPEQTALQTDAKTFDQQRATLPADQQQARAQGLQTRYTALQQKEALRQRELQVTAQKAQARIAQSMEPIVRTVYESRNCSILFNRDSAVMAGNPSMDLTDAVRASLDTSLPSITFDREHLDQQAAPR